MNFSDKLIFRFVTGISVFVFIVVVILNRKVIPAPAAPPELLYFLPKLNAILNGSCSILLLTSLYFIMQKNVAVHKRLNIAAFSLSSLFLVSYIIFHWLSPETHYRGTGNIRYVYYVILISHIILAAGVLPLILLSFYRGLQMQVERHKKLVRWTFPIWLYVTITGVIVYLMISPYYKF